MKLGTLLLRNAAIGLSQLEAALRNQVLYGGRLGTNLVELGFIDLEMLSTYLAELTTYGTATPALLDEADPRLLDKLGSDEAHRLRAIPLSFIGDDAQSVAVALVEPGDAEAIGLLTLRLGARIVPYIVPELRALYYLEKHYGTPRRARFVRTGRAGSEADGGPERRRAQPAQGIVMPPALKIEPRRRRTTSSAPMSQVPVAITFGAAGERIDTASHREQIADTLVEYARGRFDTLVVLLIREGNALGWRGYVAPPLAMRAPLEELSLPLGGVSSLQSSHDAGQTFVGEPPSAAKPVEHQLWSALGVTAEPSTVVVVPVLVKQRPVNLVYAHVLTARPQEQHVRELEELANRAQTSYLRLIRQARGA